MKQMSKKEELIMNGSLVFCLFALAILHVADRSILNAISFGLIFFVTIIWLKVKVTGDNAFFPSIKST